jgi:valine--pyruvate aminotransferase
MDVSKFGKKLAVPSGIGQLMEDLGAATSCQGEVFMLGGGNPAPIPEVEQCWRRSMEACSGDGRRFERAVGYYDPPQGNLEFLEAMAGCCVTGSAGPSARHIALTSGSQLAFFILFNLFAGEYEDGTARESSSR